MEWGRADNVPAQEAQRSVPLPRFQFQTSRPSAPKRMSTSSFDTQAVDLLSGAATKAFPFHIRAHVFQTFFLVFRLCRILFVVSRNVLAVFFAPLCSALSGAFHALAAIRSSGRNVPLGARFAGEVQPSPISLRGLAGHLAHACWRGRPAPQEPSAKPRCV
jgi:hypothetical protein